MLSIPRTSTRHVMIRPLLRLGLSLVLLASAHTVLQAQGSSSSSPEKPVPRAPVSTSVPSQGEVLERPSPKPGMPRQPQNQPRNQPRNQPQNQPQKPSRTHPAPSPSSDQAALYSLIGSRCFRPGDLIMIRGKGLKNTGDYSLQIELPGGQRTVDVVAWQGARLIAQLGNWQKLAGGHRYRLQLVDGRGRAVGQPSTVEFELCASIQTNGGTTVDRQSDAAVPGEVAVLFSSQDGDLERQISALGYRISERLQLEALNQQVYRVAVPADKALNEAVSELRAALPDAVVDVNSLYDLQASPRYYARRAINWPKDPLGCASGGRKIRIGLIDGALDLSHPALAAQSIVQKRFADGGETPQDLNHATGIAALLVGRPGTKTPTGLLPAARLYAAEVFHRDSSGADRASTIKISTALNWLADEGLRVVNLSFAGPRNAVLSASLAQAQRLGMVLIAAAGNFGPKASPAFPAADKAVIAVTALDSRRKLYRKANKGDHLDFAAPGVDIWTAKSGGGGTYRSGTSYAAPYVTAIAAAIMSEDPRRSPGLVVESMRRDATDLGMPGKDRHFGWGLIQTPKSCHGGDEN